MNSINSNINYFFKFYSVLCVKGWIYNKSGSLEPKSVGSDVILILKFTKDVAQETIHYRLVFGTLSQ